MAIAMNTAKNAQFLGKVEKALARALDEEIHLKERRERLRAALTEVSRTREALSEKIAD